jgi:antibiotic biosynthesis monooxygenase (ABM) superfamily enzyme
VTKSGQNHPNSHAFYSSLVVEHIVPNSAIAAFDRWQCELQRLASYQPGFVRLDQCPSLACDNDVIKRYTIIHFDSPSTLNDWIESKDRKRLTEQGQKIFRAYRFKSFTTGLEGWFSQRASDGEKNRLGPPVWKQILSVVLGLYPLIMLRLEFLPDTFFGNWPTTTVTLLVTLVTSSLLSIVVMPMITQMMSFWLYPAYRKSTLKIDLIGLAVICAGLLTVMLLFQQV